MSEMIMMISTLDRLPGARPGEPAEGGGDPGRLDETRSWGDSAQMGQLSAWEGGDYDDHGDHDGEYVGEGGDDDNLCGAGDYRDGWYFSV